MARVPSWVRKLIRERSPQSQRGLSLVEVLVAFFLLFVITLAVLELLSMGFMVNQGALVRTDLSYRAQRVVETLRMQRALADLGTSADQTCWPLSGSYTLPFDSNNKCYTALWGPSRANIAQQDSRFVIQYQVVGGTITVEARPRTTGAGAYSPLLATKVVRYATQL